MIRFILICMFCRKTFSSAAKFQIHMRNVHYTITSSCVDCFMETGQIVAFRRQMDLRHHVEQIHERPAGVFLGFCESVENFFVKLRHVHI